MIDFRDRQVNAEESSDVLRQRFMLLARCAAEASDDANDDTLLAAKMMADLMTIAAMFREDSASYERADEIVEFCQQRALPLLMDTASEASTKCLLQDADDRWSECLALLSPEERCSCQPTPGWIDTGIDAWTDSLKPDASDEFHATDDEPDAVNSNQQHQQPFNIAGILAALARESDPAGEQTLCRANAEKHHVTQQTAENISTNTLSTSDNCPRPIPPGELETIDDPEMVAAYADDAQQCIAEMEASLLGLESGQEADGVLRSFCRQLHTLKGASGTVGLSRLAKYLHDLEGYIERTAGCQIDIDKLLDCVDAVRAQLSALGISGTGVTIVAASSPKAVSEQHPRGQSPLPSVTGGNDNELFVRVEASRLERLMDLLAELVMLRNRRDAYVDSLRNIHRELNSCAARTRTLTSTIEYTTPATAAGETSSDIASERSTAKSRLLSRTLDEVSKDTAELGRSLQEVFDPLSDDNSAVSHLIGQFRQELMELRRLPIGGLFQRLQRVVRDAAKSEGKLVEVAFEGQGARAERAVQERLFEPLLHLVRNAVSHGLDTPDGRTKSGKPAVGRITLAARSDAASLCIEVRDDGRGLNDEALEARGRELGLLPSGVTVSRTQLWKLIFHPGFSTKSSVSEISGRGVGMDVVDSWVKRLRGRIEVESVPGKGTTMRLHIPLRSAVEHAMVVRAGGQLFALPMHTVSGTSDSRQPMRIRANSTSDRQIIPLSRILGCKANQTTHGCSISLRSTSVTARTTQHSGDNVTIAVDAIVGVEEVVVRTLPSLLQRNELFAGVTLSGRAETVLLLDVRKVIDLCHRTERPYDQSTKPVPADGTSCRHANSNRCVLVVDDSFVVRRSLSRKLRAVGCEVHEAANGREALVALHACGITAVVTDLDMSGMTGVELLQEIKRHKQFKTIPVTVLTSRDDESMLAEVRQLDPAAVLHKPVTDATIKAILDSLICADVAIS